MVYGTGGRLVTGQSKTMFTQWVEMWLLGGNRYYGMGVTNVQGKDNTGGYTKNIQVTAEAKRKSAMYILTMFTR